MNGQKYEFPSKVIRKVNQSVLVEPIRINGKILSFNSSGGGIMVSVYMIRDSKPPMLWKGVAVNSIREDNGTFYKITANGEGFEVNRRGAFRLFIGISGVAQLGTNRKAVDVIVKDVSESGFSFVGMEDMDNVINMPVRLVFADFNQNYSLMGIIVRKVVIGENKIVYGCRLGVRNANLEQYISQKQRQMLSMNHGNSAFQNKEILEKALKEPGRAAGQHRKTNRMIRIIRKSRLRMTEHIKKEILIKLVKLKEEIYSEIHLKERRYDYETYFKTD